MREYYIIIKPDVLVCVEVLQHMVANVDEIFHNKQELTLWANANKVKKVKLILDLPDEEVYTDAHPELHSWEFKNYADRQTYKRFPATEFVKTSFLNKPDLPWKTTKGNIHLMGFNEDTIIKKVIGWLDDLQVNIAAIHSSVNILQQLLLQTWFNTSKLKEQLKRQPTLLLVRVGKQDFRQLLFINGAVHTSRVVSVAGQDLEEQIHLLLQEVVLLEKFVHTQKVMSVNDTIAVRFLVANEQEKETICRVFSDSNELTCDSPQNFISMQQMLADMTVDQIYDRLLAATLSNIKLKSDYHTKLTKQTEQIKWATLFMWFVFFAAVLATLIYVVAFFTKQYETEQAIHRLEMIKKEQKNYIDRFMRYNDIENLAQYELNDIRLAVDAYNTINELQKKVDLQPVLLSLSRVLTVNPQVRLLDLSLTQNKDEQKPVNVGRGAKPVVSSSGLLDHLSMSFSIQVDAEDKLSSKIEQVDAFVRSLNEIDPERLVDARLSQQPFNVGSEQALTFKFDDERSEKNTIVPFEVIMKVLYE